MDDVHNTSATPALTCPPPLAPAPIIQLAHGGGGRHMHELLNRMLPLLPGSAAPSHRHDGAVLSLPADARLAFTTDSYVVSPLVFPGGDIGRLAVHGTINDLAMCGARPLALSCSLLIEEGFAIADLERLLHSLATAATEAQVSIVTGDTKVVEHGKGDGLYLNTSGIGAVAPGVDIGPHRIAAGDAIILSGDLGRHAVAVMSARSKMRFDPVIDSDTAPLHTLVQDLLAADIPVHCLRDPTRGGLVSTLVELAEAANLNMRLIADHIPVSAGVRAACEILGLDPLYLANEGRMVVLVPAQYAEATVATLRRSPAGRGAAIIGSVAASPTMRGMVVLTGPYGTERILPMLSGEQMPRIC